jgi:D-glycero-D-manno-heptose 1,7-bisphosphate phosphatase
MKNKAIFLDRDGILIRERGDWTWRTEDCEILPGVFEVLRKFRREGFLLIVVSNQSGIDLKFYSHEDTEKLHTHLLSELEKHGAMIDEIYYCPHHPTVGKCLCRKPGHLLFEKAIARFSIDVSKSFMIGDRDRDIAAAENTGVKGFLVESNRPLTEILDRFDFRHITG